MNKNYTKEPWSEFNENVNRTSDWRGNCIRISEYDYERARACVNACAGMDNPEAEIQAIRSKGSVDLAVLANAVRHYLPPADTNMEQVQEAARMLKNQVDVIAGQLREIANLKANYEKLQAVSGEWQAQLVEAIGAKDYLFKHSEELEEIRQQQRKQIEALQIELARQPFDQGTLRQFIAGVEARNFRTVQDTGANQNAMFLWNQLRRFAGLPEITRDSLPAYCVTCKTYHRDPHEREKEAVPPADTYTKAIGDLLEKQKKLSDSNKELEAEVERLKETIIRRDEGAHNQIRDRDIALDEISGKLDFITARAENLIGDVCMVSSGGFVTIPNEAFVPLKNCIHVIKHGGMNEKLYSAVEPSTAEIKNEGAAPAAYPGGRWTPNPVQSSESTPVRPQLDVYEAHLVGSDPKPWDGSVTIVAESLGDALKKACEIAIKYGGVVLGVRKRIDPAREPHPGLV